MKREVIMVCPHWKQYRIYRRTHGSLTDNLSLKAFRAARTFEFLEECLNELTARDHFLFIWVTAKFTEECRSYMERLGYRYSGYQVWYRPLWKRGSSGRTFEYLMLYVKGARQFTEIELPDAITSPFTRRVRRKGQKPEDAYNLLANLFPVNSKLQIFGFVNRPGWTSIHYNAKKILNL